MTIRNLGHMLAPKSVAFFGASEREGTVGGMVSRNLLAGGFGGDIWFVNPHHDTILGQPVFKDAASLPAAPELAVLATPPPTIPALIGELGALGTRAAVVITAGFGEGGDHVGAKLAQAALDAARPHLLRILGPNGVGLLVPGIGLNASFAPAESRPGRIAFLSQSGAVITSVLDWAAEHGIGFSCIASLGDMIDVDFGDLLDWLAQDRETDAVLLYIEGVTQARKFMSAARALARIKPVVVMKAGRHAEGARAAASHTGAMAGADAVYDAAFRRAGLVRVYDMLEMFAAVETLALAEPPKNDRLAIVSNGGGVGVLATDRLTDLGGRLAELAPETVEALNGVLPSTWSHGNPIDIIGDATGPRYAAAIKAVAADRGVGAILVLNAPTALASSQDAANAVVEAAPKRPPLLTSWLGGTGAEAARQQFTDAGIATYDTPSEAVRAFMYLVDYAQGQQALMETPQAIPANTPPDRAAARAIIEGALKAERTLLTEPEAKSVLAAYGIAVAETRIARDAAEARDLAEAIGYPVAVKILSREITHKSDVGGVALELIDAAAVEAAVAEIETRVRAARPDAHIDGYAVQAMIDRPGAQEVIVGVADDPQFGPVILFGHGGTAAEAIDDKALALPPLNLNLAHALMRRTRVHRLLKGFRDRPPADLDAVAAVLVRLSWLVADFPEIAELDINPLLADPTGAIALDARIVVRAAPDGDPTARFAIRPYPVELEAEVEHRGKKYLLRPIRAEDEPALIAAFAQMTPEDIRMRFFAPVKQMSHALAARLTQIDYDREMAFVLLDPRGEGNQLYGVVRLSADPDFETAEFAITVMSGEGGKGYGYLMMERIIDYARSRGIGLVVGDALGENQRMIALARSLGFTVRPAPEEMSIMRLELKLD